MQIKIFLFFMSHVRGSSALSLHFEIFIKMHYSVIVITHPHPHSHPYHILIHSWIGYQQSTTNRLDCSYLQPLTFCNHNWSAERVERGSHVSKQNHIQMQFMTVHVDRFFLFLFFIRSSKEVIALWPLCWPPLIVLLSTLFHYRWKDEKMKKKKRDMHGWSEIVNRIRIHWIEIDIKLFFFSTYIMCGCGCEALDP